MRDNRYDVVHAYQASHGGGAAWLTKIFLPNLHFVLTIQEGKKLDEQLFLLNWLRGLIIKKADTVTVISNYLKEYVQKVSKNKDVFLIPNGVDLKNFQFPISNFQSNLNFKNSKSESKTIITVSRLVPKNGLKDLIKAFHILTNDLKPNTYNLKLLIIGEGPEREKLRELTKNLEIENEIKFLGNIPNSEVPKYLAQVDVFVRPSLSEGLGTSFLEAMASGLPIIGTPVGGIPDFLKDPSTHSGQATGLFCKVSDPEDIAEKINKILTDDDLRNKLIVNGRKLVEEKYSWDKIADQFKNLYNSLS